ncbi:hypothetical protein RxyAA322_05900 [Rubrobacter xylanophilus]|uniref:Uncharacterized protein n=1 Tax=Rubrobacter xylanophilus TaxID=49319 RepID=A0A510HFM1_9ACTN|nr:hypothetical protein [Rubrobacter xylanophilus]BBL78736.1 hypothetical protein RxyAA322_05900 [Rubrobacter xylanophilus]
MARSVFLRALRAARSTAAMMGVAVALALVAGVASAAFGANGDAWRLGVRNAATAITDLGGGQGVNGPMLRLTNNNPGTDDTALTLRVQAGEPPLRVNSGTRVDSLNADMLDGRDSSGFMSSGVYRLGSGQERQGTVLGDGTKVLSQSCLPGDRLLSGGPASVNAASRVLDSFPTNTTTWQARVNDSAVPGGDSFTVVVLCADQ